MTGAGNGQCVAPPMILVVRDFVMISESDWKKFKKIKASALERFCASALADFEDAIACSDASNHARFLRLYELVQDHNKRLALLFDGLSRSRASMQLMLMRKEGLVTDDELGTLSEALRKSTDPYR